MLIGINRANPVSYGTHLESPDVVVMGRFVDVPNLQRVLAEDYEPGSNRLVFDRHNDPWYAPNGLIVGECKIPTTAGPIVVQYRKLARHPYMLIRWGDDDASQAKKAIFDAADKSGWLAGVTPIDFADAQWKNESTDPDDWLMEEFVTEDGRHTGLPSGLRAGQRMIFNIIDPTRIPLPGGDWTITFPGTGAFELAIGYRDRTTEYQTITFTDGVASGPMVIAGDEFQSLRMTLHTSSPSAPLHDPRIIMPGIWPEDLDSDGRGYEGKTFVQIYAEHADDPAFFLPHPDMIRDLRHFGHARQVDAMTTINFFGAESYCGIVDPADRALPTMGLGKHNNGEGGATPWEWLIETANLARQDFWLCTGHQWADATIVEFCDVFKSLADASVKLIEEYSCETWNFSFAEYYAAVILGSAYFNPRALDSLAYDSGTGKAIATRTAHGFGDGDEVQIFGASEAAYNGEYTISNVTADTFRYTPASVPTNPTALPTSVGRPGAFEIGSARTAVVTSLEYRWDEGGFRVATETAVVAKDDVVAICNVDAAGVDGYYLVDRPAGYAANEFFLNPSAQGLNHPILEPIDDPATFSPVAGREIRVCVLASQSPSAEAGHVSGAMNLWSGHRTATTAEIILEQFADDPGRVVPMVAGFQAIPSFNEARAEAFLDVFGGELPGVPEVGLAVATYHEDYSLDHRAVFGGDVKPLASLVVSGGVATATVADYLVEWGESFYTDDHNWANGDQITIQNVATAGANGKFTMTSTGAGTFTMPMPGVADGALEGFSGPIIAIKDNTSGIQLLGVSRDGHDVTYTAPGHPFTVGQLVGVDRVAAAVHEDIFEVKAATSDTFTVEVDCDFDPTFNFPGRGAAFDAALTSIYPASYHAYIDGAEYEGIIDDLVSVAEQYGMTPNLYESGTHYTEQTHAGIVPWVGGIVKASMRTEAMHDAIVKSVALHASKGLARYTYYTITRIWGAGGENFGVNEYQGDTRSRKWTGLLAAIEANSTGGGGMERPVFKTPLDFRETTVAANRTAGAGSLVVASGSVFGTPSPSAPVRVTVVRESTGAATHLICTGRTGNTLTVAADAVAVAAGHPDINLVVGDYAGVTASNAQLGEVQDAVLELFDVVDELESGAVASVAGKTGAVTLDTADVDGLDDALGGKAPTSHAHATTDITSGVLAPARLATGTPAAGKYPDPVNGWTTLPAGEGGAPGGSTTQVQYNDSGAFAGSADFVLSSANRLQINGTSPGNNGTISIGAYPGAPSYAGFWCCDPATISGTNYNFLATASEGGIAKTFFNGPGAGGVVGFRANNEDVIVVDSSGGNRRVGFFGVTPTTRPSGDIGAALVSLGLMTSPSGGGGSGTVTTASVVSANGFAGTVATATTTPAITISTTITGLLKGNGTAISAAVAGTDYATAAQGAKADSAIQSADLAGYATTTALADHTGTAGNPHSTTAAQVGAYTTSEVDGLLSTVNTAIGGKSPIAGSSSIVTVGTVTSGTWSATAIGVTKGGTGLASIASGKLLYASASNTLAELTLGTNLSITSGTLNAAGGGGGSTVYSNPGSGSGSERFGDSALADGQDSAAFGKAASAGGYGSVAFGKGASTPANFATAFGFGASAANSTSMAFGINSLTDASNQFMAGAASFNINSAVFNAGTGGFTLAPRVESTATQRNAGKVAFTLANTADATWKGRVAITAGDFSSSHTAQREGIRVESDGTQALLGFYGAAATAKGAAIADATDATSAITQINLALARMRALGLIEP